MLDFLLSPARMSFCEPAVEGFVKHPADTWSNIGPIFAGLWVLCYAKSSLIKLMGLAAFWMGVASCIFHATDTLLGEALDLHGMYCFILMVACAHHQSLGYRVETMWAGIFSFSLATLIVAGFLAVEPLGTPAFALVMAAVIIRQWRLGFHTYWYYVLGTFAVAWGVWWLDYLRIWCCPTCHVLSGHALWHLLNGVIVWQTWKIFEPEEMCNVSPAR